MATPKKRRIKNRKCSGLILELETWHHEITFKLERVHKLTTDMRIKQLISEIKGML